ncbi:MAG: hypothetical protein ACTSRZ_13415 [Promethearchaeota archaeon]
MVRNKFNSICILDENFNILYQTNVLEKKIMEVIKFYLISSNLIKEGFKQSYTVLEKSVFYVVKKSLNLHKINGKYQIKENIVLKENTDENEIDKEGNKLKKKENEQNEDFISKDLLFVGIAKFKKNKVCGKMIKYLNTISSTFYIKLISYLKDLKSFEMSKILDFFKNHSSIIFPFVKKYMK